MPASSLYDTASELLAACANSLTAEGLTPPAHRYVSWGAPATDCDTLAVAIGAVGTRTNTTAQSTVSGRRDASNPAGSIIETRFVVWVARCVQPVGAQPPAAEAIAAAAQVASVDLWVLANALRRLARSGALFPGCDRVTWLDATPLDAAGGLAGFTLPVNVEIPGYTPAVAS